MIAGRAGFVNTLLDACAQGRHVYDLVSGTPSLATLESSDA